MHRLINNTDRTLDVVFLRFIDVSFTITLSPKELEQTLSLSCTLTRHALEKILNLEKTTYSVLSVLLLIYAFVFVFVKYQVYANL